MSRYGNRCAIRLDVAPIVPYEKRYYVRHSLQIVQMTNAPPLDRLSALLERFQIRAGVFHTGAMCGTKDFATPESVGLMHILRGGHLRVTDADGTEREITEPAVLFYPRGLPHRLDTGAADREIGLLCARVDLGGAASPIAAALPDAIVLTAAPGDGLRATLDVLAGEAFASNCGRQAVLDRLCEVVVVKLLRHVIGGNRTTFGMFAGLAHPMLCRALTALHDAPDRNWTLESLAETAGMSRTAFANAFRETVGQTPGNYLAAWRLTLADEQLSKGAPLKTVARSVGYASPAALSRAYARQFGHSPRAARSREVVPA